MVSHWTSRLILQCKDEEAEHGERETRQNSENMKRREKQRFYCRWRMGWKEERKEWRKGNQRQRGQRGGEERTWEKKMSKVMIHSTENFITFFFSLALAVLQLVVKTHCSYFSICSWFKHIYIAPRSILIPLFRLAYAVLHFVVGNFLLMFLYTS